METLRDTGRRIDKISSGRYKLIRSRTDLFRGLPVRLKNPNNCLILPFPDSVGGFKLEQLGRRSHVLIEVGNFWCR